MFIRSTKNTLQNNDSAEYKAALIRKKRDDQIQETMILVKSLLERVSKLEQQIETLTKQ